MKVRVALPDHLTNVSYSGQTEYKRQYHVDDILLWCMEMGIDVEFYGFQREIEPNSVWHIKKIWMVFIVDSDMSDQFMFKMAWNADQYKTKKKENVTT